MPSVWRKTVGVLIALLILQALAERGGERSAASPETRPATTHQQPNAKARAKARAKAKAAKAKAKAAAPNRPQPKTRRCPVAGKVSFIDSWRHPRTGHRHQGVDMMAAEGTTLVAVEDGTIGNRIGSMGISGKRLWVYGRSGTRYFYAHLARIDVRAGERVRVGQPVGLVGATGNAAGGAPHLHFEQRPGGGAAVNPYPSVKAWCG